MHGSCQACTRYCSGSTSLFLTFTNSPWCSRGKGSTMQRPSCGARKAVAWTGWGCGGKLGDMVGLYACNSRGPLRLPGYSRAFKGMSSFIQQPRKDHPHLGVSQQLKQLVRRQRHLNLQPRHGQLQCQQREGAVGELSRSTRPTDARAPPTKPPGAQGARGKPSECINARSPPHPPAHSPVHPSTHLLALLHRPLVH